MDRLIAQSCTAVLRQTDGKFPETGWRDCDNLAISQLQHEREAA
jgi:hypothetical protein